MTHNSRYPSAAFIDVDLTLLDLESFKSFLYYLYAGSDINKLFSFILALFNYKIGIGNTEKFKQKCLQNLKGMDRKEIESIGYKFCKNILVKNTREGALRCIGKHNIAGTPVFLASASPSFYIKALSEYFNLSGYVATELKFDGNQKFSGEFLYGDCHGKKKLLQVRKFASRFKINLHDSIFYSDNYEDLPTLLAVGYPVAVWPDNKLKKICRLNSWPIEYW
jgi:HAD superfamily hydrolase (TIGR01490 family)